MAPILAELPLQLAQLALMCPALQCAHHPTPTPGLLQREREGDLSQAPHPASFPRGPNQNPLLPPCLMRAAMDAQHLKMTVSLMVRVRLAVMMETLTTAAGQMMKAPTAASQAVKKHQPMRVPSRIVQTMKARGLSDSETEGSDTGGSNSPSKSDHTESPPKASPPAKKALEVNLNTSQMLSLPDLDSKDSEEEWKAKWH